MIFWLQDSRVPACSPPPPQAPFGPSPCVAGHRLQADRVCISCKIILLGARVERETSDGPQLDFLNIYLPNFNSVDVHRQNQVLSECTTDSVKNHLPFFMSRI